LNELLAVLNDQDDGGAVTFSRWITLSRLDCTASCTSK